MLVVWITLGIALVVHEGSHYVLLRWAGLHPRPSFHFPGLGWRFSTGGATTRQLVDIWLVGPLMEGLVWGAAALLFSRWAWELLLVMAVEMGTNLLLPGSDGRRALRLIRRRRSLQRSTDGPAADPAVPPLGRGWDPANGGEADSPWAATISGGRSTGSSGQAG